MCVCTTSYMLYDVSLSFFSLPDPIPSTMSKRGRERHGERGVSRATKVIDFMELLSVHACVHLWPPQQLYRMKVTLFMWPD